MRTTHRIGESYTTHRMPNTPAVYPCTVIIHFTSRGPQPKPLRTTRLAHTAPKATRRSNANHLDRPRRAYGTPPGQKIQASLPVRAFPHALRALQHKQTRAGTHTHIVIFALIAQSLGALHDRLGQVVLVDARGLKQSLAWRWEKQCHHDNGERQVVSVEKPSEREARGN